MTNRETWLASAARVIGAGLVIAVVGTLSASAESSGKSKAETMEFIRSSIAAQGAVSYSINMQDTANDEKWTVTMSAEPSKLQVDPSQCKLSYHWRTVVNGEQKQDHDLWVEYGQGTKVTITNREQEIRQQVKTAGHPTWIGTVSPAVWVVVASSTDGVNNTFNFTNQDTAERVARAQEHLMDLCGAKREGF